MCNFLIDKMVIGSAGQQCTSEAVGFVPLDLDLEADRHLIAGQQGCCLTCHFICHWPSSGTQASLLYSTVTCLYLILGQSENADVDALVAGAGG